MKILVKVTRLTEYATIVEMTKERMEELNMELTHSDRRRRNQAEKAVNKLVDTNDWQDDDFHSCELLEEVKEDSK